MVIAMAIRFKKKIKVSYPRQITLPKYVGDRFPNVTEFWLTLLEDGKIILEPVKEGD